MNEMYRELLDSLRRLHGHEATYFGYEDPSPETATGTGYGSLAFLRGDSRRTDRVEMTSIPPNRGLMIARVLTQSRGDSEYLFVDDLHRLLVRCDTAINNISCLDKSVICMSFCRAWAGYPTMTWQDFGKKLQVAMPIIGQMLWRSLPSEAKQFYYDHYVPTIIKYAKHEQKPIRVYNEKQQVCQAWVHYKFTAGKTSRLIPYGQLYDRRTNYFNPHSVPRDKRHEYIKANRGRRIVTIDYNAAEMRTLAALSKDDGLKQVFKRGDDLYSEILGKHNLHGVDRSTTKNIVLQLFYGGYGKYIAHRIGVNESTVAAIQARMKSSFGRAWNYLDELAEKAIQEGGVYTCTGRAIRLDDKSSARRSISNACIQSVTADLNNVAFANLSSEGGRSIALLHIHDGYVFDFPYEHLDEEIEYFTEMAANNPIDSYLPGVILKTETKVGKVWE